MEFDNVIIFYAELMDDLTRVIVEHLAKYILAQSFGCNHNICNHTRMSTSIDGMLSYNFKLFFLTIITLARLKMNRF